MSTKGCTVGMRRIVVNGVMYEVPIPVCDEIERLQAVVDAALEWKKNNEGAMWYDLPLLEALAALKGEEK